MCYVCRVRITNNDGHTDGIDGKDLVISRRIISNTFSQDILGK